MSRCPNCRHELVEIPAEPAPDSWVRDRFGSVHHRNRAGTGWGQPGCYYFGDWRAMWEARGPLVECAPWGRDGS